MHMRVRLGTAVFAGVFAGAAMAHPEELADSFSRPSEATRAEAAQPELTGRPLWEIGAVVPFFGSPVHERMTVRAIDLSRVHGRSYRPDYDDAYIRGVFWNDDPLELLCPGCSALNPLKFDKRWGAAFALRFVAAKDKATGAGGSGAPYFFQGGDGLLERSHFGDLQFLHGMAARDGEPAGETQGKILAWAEFTYRVAIGEIDQRLRVDEIPVPAIRDLLAADASLAASRIEDLFRGPSAARRAALGSLLHVVQDSYAGGHAQRVAGTRQDAAGNTIFSRGAVVRFHSYVHQDPEKHKRDDRWPDGLDDPDPAADDNPISVGARILAFAYAQGGRGTPWPRVRDYLRDVVFQVQDPRAAAGPGADYVRRPP